MAALQSTGLQEDCPFSLEEGAEAMSPESAEEVSEEAFAEYAGRLNSYLQARPRPAVLHRAGLMYMTRSFAAFLRDKSPCWDDTFGKAVQLTMHCAFGATTIPWFGLCPVSREGAG